MYARVSVLTWLLAVSQALESPLAPYFAQPHGALARRSLGCMQATRLEARFAELSTNLARRSTSSSRGSSSSSSSSSFKPKKPKFGGGDDDDDGCSNACLDMEQVCGEGCIPNDARCCVDLGDDSSLFCPSDRRCVETTLLYRCCPSGDDQCDEDNTANATSPQIADFRFSNDADVCPDEEGLLSGAATQAGGWGFAVAGLLFAAGVFAAG